MSYVQELPHTGRTASFGADDKTPALDDKASAHEVDVTVTPVDQAFEDLVKEEEEHDIKLRTMSWQKTAVLLFGDQVCLAIMAQAWSFKVLGWIPGLITTFLSGGIFWLTSYTLWQYMMRHPQVRDICDIGRLLFGGSRMAYEFTGIMLLANNSMLAGFHVLTGAKILNTLSNHALCTVYFSVIVTIASILLSLPRTLHHVSHMCTVSAACMFVAIVLQLVFAGIEDHPASGYGGDYPAMGVVKTSAFPVAGTTWVQCLNAVLNISFLWIPQILFPTFITEMRRPQDFPKSLAALAAASFVLFIVPAVVGYAYLGQYAEAPAFGSLEELYKKISFAPVIVPTIVIGVIYCNVSSKYVLQRVLGNSRHRHSNTVVGWGVWAAIVTAFWVVAFIFGETIPSMGDFLSLLGSVFDSQYGFIFWALAYAQLYKGRFFTSKLRTLITAAHAVIMVMGLFLLGPGLYAAVEAIREDYAGAVRPAFACANLAI